MKVLIFLGLCIAIWAAPARIEEPKLKPELVAIKQEFQKLYPVAEMNALGKKYFNNCENIQKLAIFLIGPEMQTIWKDVIATEEAEAIGHLLEPFFDSENTDNNSSVLMMDDNWDILFFVDREAVLDEPENCAFSNYLQDLTNLMPLDKLRSLNKKKVQESDLFRKLMETLGSVEMGTEFLQLIERPDLEPHFDKLAEHGVNVFDMIRTIATMFGMI